MAILNRKNRKNTENTKNNPRYLMIIVFFTLFFTLLLLTQLASAQQKQTYVYGPNGLVAVKTGDNINYVIGDRYSNLIVTDNNGDTKFTQICSPFGVQLKSSGTNPIDISCFGRYDKDIEVYFADGTVGAISDPNLIIDPSAGPPYFIGNSKNPVYDPNAGVWLGIHWPGFFGYIGNTILGMSTSIVEPFCEPKKYFCVSHGDGSCGISSDLIPIPLVGSIQGIAKADNWWDRGGAIAGLVSEVGFWSAGGVAGYKAVKPKVVPEQTTAIVKYDPGFAKWQIRRNWPKFRPTTPLEIGAFTEIEVLKFVGKGNYDVLYHHIGSPTKKGFDTILKNKRTGDIMIVESKWRKNIVGGKLRTYLPKVRVRDVRTGEIVKTRQMTKKWIELNALKLRAKSNPAGQEILNALDEGRLRRYLYIDGSKDIKYLNKVTRVPYWLNFDEEFFIKQGIDFDIFP